jgi:hypothetical protein
VRNAREGASRRKVEIKQATPEDIGRSKIGQLSPGMKVVHAEILQIRILDSRLSRHAYRLSRIRSYSKNILMTPLSFFDPHFKHDMDRLIRQMCRGSCNASDSNASPFTVAPERTKIEGDRQPAAGDSWKTASE